MPDVKLLTPAELAELRRLIHEAQTNPDVGQFGQSLAEARATVALHLSIPALLLAAELLPEMAIGFVEAMAIIERYGHDLFATSAAHDLLARYHAATKDAPDA